MISSVGCSRHRSHHRPIQLTAEPPPSACKCVHAEHPSEGCTRGDSWLACRSGEQQRPVSPEVPDRRVGPDRFPSHGCGNRASRSPRRERAARLERLKCASQMNASEIIDMGINLVEPPYTGRQLDVARLPTSARCSPRLGSRISVDLIQSSRTQKNFGAGNNQGLVDLQANNASDISNMPRSFCSL